jgi:hypothetical protein
MKSSSTTEDSTHSKMSSYDDAAGEPHQHQQHPVVLDALKKQDSSGILLTAEFQHQLRAQDICCGRGRGYWRKHPGNKTFNHLIQANAYLYSMCSVNKHQNSRLVTSIVEGIRNNGVRFVQEDKQNAGRWIELDKAESREKTRHAIRDQKKTAMKMGVTRSREIHQISPNPSAAVLVNRSYPRTPNVLSHFLFYQEARMRASALDEPCYPRRQGMKFDTFYHPNFERDEHNRCVNASLQEMQQATSSTHAQCARNKTLPPEGTSFARSSAAAMAVNSFILARRRPPANVKPFQLTRSNKVAAKYSMATCLFKNRTPPGMLVVPPYEVIYNGLGRGYYDPSAKRHHHKMCNRLPQWEDKAGVGLFRR